LVAAVSHQFGLFIIMEKQILISSGAKQLLGFLSLPEDEVKGAVLFCNALFEEHKSASRAMVEAMRFFAGKNVASLRFDYRGCGDSEGAFCDDGVSDWLEDIHAALQSLRNEVGDIPCCLLGLRVGAALALHFLQTFQTTPIDALVLWEPVMNGKHYLNNELRRKLMKEMLTNAEGESKSRRTELFETLEQGSSVDFDGYELTSRLYHDLCQLKLDEGDFRSAPPTFLASVGAGERPNAQICKFVTIVRDQGAEILDVHLRMQPFWSLVGYVDCGELFLQTSRFLQRSLLTKSTE
jgi:exosortase A-associated hydrolase 2